MAIDLGDLYRLSFNLKSPAGGDVNATAMALTITLPDGTTTSPTVVNPPATTGQYFYDYQTVQAGRHLARWVGTGTNPGAYVEVFDVRPADVPYIISLADAKQQCNITGTGDDDELRAFLEAATGIVERHLGQAVVRRSYTEEHRITGGVVVLNKTPVISLTSVAAVDGSQTWDVNALHVTPAGVLQPTYGYFKAPRETSFTMPENIGALNDLIQVTYIAGMSVIPEEIALGTRIVIQHLWQTQRGPAGAPVQGAGVLNAPPPTGSTYVLPFAAQEALGGGMPGFA